MVNDPKNEDNIENKDESSDEADSEQEETSPEHEVENAESDDQSDADGLVEPEDDESEAVAADNAEDETSPIDSDPVDTPQAEAPVVAPPVPARSGSSLGMVFGGLIAGAIGFLAATFGVPDWIPKPPNSAETSEVASAASADLAEEVSGVSEALAAQTARLDDLQGQLEAASVSATEGGVQNVDLSPLDSAIGQLNEDVSAVSTQIDELISTLAELDARVAALESRPEGQMPAMGDAAMEAQLNAFRSELDAVTASARAEIEAAQERASAIEEAAAKTASDAKRNAALSKIQAALESGAPFSEELAVFDTVPEALSRDAETGVATIGQLQADFPAIARAALSTARAVPDDANTGDRIAAFLRRQTNARSLSPQEGDTVDAVLSRAEAALASGDVSGALSELDSLQGSAREAFGDWIAAASLRAEAIAAFQSLTADVN